MNIRSIDFSEEKVKSESELFEEGRAYEWWKLKNISNTPKPEKLDVTVDIINLSTRLPGWRSRLA